MKPASALCVLALVTGMTVVAPLPAQQRATWADPAKTLRVMFPIAETGFDPQPSQDYYSANVIRLMFDALYEPDYLARPYRWVPNTAAGMPEISKDGMTWTIRVKPGIHFSDDPALCRAFKPPKYTTPIPVTDGSLAPRVIR